MLAARTCEPRTSSYAWRLAPPAMCGPWVPSAPAIHLRLSLCTVADLTEEGSVIDARTRAQDGFSGCSERQLSLSEEYHGVHAWHTTSISRWMVTLSETA